MLNSSLYIFEFLILQIFILIYFKYLKKNKVTPGSIGAYSGIFLLQIIIIFNLVREFSIIEILIRNFID